MIRLRCIPLAFKKHFYPIYYVILSYLLLLTFQWSTNYTFQAFYILFYYVHISLCIFVKFTPILFL